MLIFFSALAKELSNWKPEIVWFQNELLLGQNPEIPPQKVRSQHRRCFLPPWFWRETNHPIVSWINWELDSWITLLIALLIPAWDWYEFCSAHSLVQDTDPGKPSAGAREAADMGTICGSCAELGQGISIFQCPPHSGTGWAWFSSQPHGKVHHREVGSNGAPSSTSSPVLGKSCGIGVLWLLSASKTVRCSCNKGMHVVYTWFITVVQKQLRNAQAFETISHLIYAHREQILGWLLPFLSRYRFLFEDEKQESCLRGQAEPLTNQNALTHHPPHQWPPVCTLQHNILLSEPSLLIPFTDSQVWPFLFQREAPEDSMERTNRRNKLAINAKQDCIQAMDSNGAGRGPDLFQVLVQQAARRENPFPPLFLVHRVWPAARHSDQPWAPRGSAWSPFWLPGDTAPTELGRQWRSQRTHLKQSCHWCIFLSALLTGSTVFIHSNKINQWL